MTLNQFAIVWLATLATILACRVIPIFVLKNRDMPESLQKALGLIPPAAFAALVANDLLSPDMFSQGLWAGLEPLLSAVLVLFVARKTHSLIWCAVVGVTAYAVLSIM